MRHARIVESETPSNRSILESFAAEHPNATIVELWEELVRLQATVEPFARAAMGALPQSRAKAAYRPAVARPPAKAPFRATDFAMPVVEPVEPVKRRRRRRRARVAIQDTVRTQGRTAAPLERSEVEPLRYFAKSAKAAVVADLPRILRAVYKYLLRTPNGATRTQVQAFLRPYKTPWADGPLRQLRLRGLLTRKH